MYVTEVFNEERDWKSCGRHAELTSLIKVHVGGCPYLLYGREKAEQFFEGIQLMSLSGCNVMLKEEVKIAIPQTGFVGTAASIPYSESWIAGSCLRAYHPMPAFFGMDVRTRSDKRLPVSVVIAIVVGLDILLILFYAGEFLKDVAMLHIEGLVATFNSIELSKPFFERWSSNGNFLIATTLNICLKKSFRNLKGFTEAWLPQGDV